MTAFTEIGAADQVMFDPEERRMRGEEWSWSSTSQRLLISSQSCNFGTGVFAAFGPASRHISIFDVSLALLDIFSYRRSDFSHFRPSVCL